MAECSIRQMAQFSGNMRSMRIRSIQRASGERFRREIQRSGLLQFISTLLQDMNVLAAVQHGFFCALKWVRLQGVLPHLLPVGRSRHVCDIKCLQSFVVWHCLKNGFSRFSLRPHYADRQQPAGVRPACIHFPTTCSSPDTQIRKRRQ